MNGRISWGLRFLIPASGLLKNEIEHWLFLETWDAPLPSRDERHVQVKIATDASASGWGGCVLSPTAQEVSDYWVDEELSWDIATKEATAIERVLEAFRDILRNVWVDVQVDNEAVIKSWNNQGGKSPSLNKAVKSLFFTTLSLNISLHLSYVSSKDNPADAPSRRLSVHDCTLTLPLWQKIQQNCGGPLGHSCDLMALDSNAMTDLAGCPLPHFTPYPSPKSSGVNLFAQHLPSFGPLMRCPYAFPPTFLVGALLRFLASQRQSCTIVVLDEYPCKYWWPLLMARASFSQRLALAGDSQVLLSPSPTGWVPCSGIPGDLWVFIIKYSL